MILSYFRSKICLLKRALHNKSKIYRKKHIFIDSKTMLSAKTSIEPYVSIVGGGSIIDSKIGTGTYVGVCSQLDYCKIGNYCSIGSDVRIFSLNHPLSYVSTSPVFYKSSSSQDTIKKINTKATFNNERLIIEDSFSVIIGHDCWIGDCVRIKGGVNIGTGSVIGCGSVVTHDVPPFAIVAGNPAKIIRFRFDQSVIDALLKSEWWLKDRDVLSKLTFENVNRFLEEINEKDSSNM